MRTQSEAARIRKKHEREKKQRTPILTVLNTNEKFPNHELAWTVHSTFKKVLMCIYDFPFNVQSSEFERMGKKADYLMIIGKNFPENMNIILDLIVKRNYEAKIIVQKGMKISALKRKKTIIIDSNCEPEQIKKLLS
jgi:hypothetical protein